MLLLLFAGIMDTIKEVISLQKDKQTAVVASEMKTEFLANMSHEIRTPINAILGMNEMILRESTEENIASYATDVDNSGRMLLMLINDVLDFSKIESGRMELVESEFDIVSALSDVYMLIRLKVKEKNLVFNVNIDPDIPKMVMGDENRYKQALTNILTNAVKYTEKGSVSLNVTGRALEDGKFLIEAIVKDTGIGIKKDDLDKLFDAFQRVDEKKNRSIEGTGLGLAITQQIVSLMGGDIRVESTYGKGSTFTISIVFKVSGTETVGETNFDKYEGKKEKAQLREFSSPGSKVLVVDDVAMNIRVFMQFIKNTGIDAESALSGKEAIDKWKKTKYDLVFLDHMMPELDGIETARIMWKENEVNKDTPIIMLTANAIAGMKEKYEAEGFSDYITKPFKYDEFIDALEKYLPNKNTGPDIAKIDIEAGMVYCANDKDFYKEVLNEYLESDKTADLKARYEEKDAENLRILVHSLKSTSKTVGATEFSQLALELENAVKAEDWQTIDALFDNTISGYAAVRDEVRKVFEEI
nr:response regulator [Eubacterium sp.]